MVPDVKKVDRQSVDEFIVIASDGLWDVTTNDYLVKKVHNKMYGKKDKKSPTLEDLKENVAIMVDECWSRDR